MIENKQKDYSSILNDYVKSKIDNNKSYNGVIEVYFGFKNDKHICINYDCLESLLNDDKPKKIKEGVEFLLKENKIVMNDIGNDLNIENLNKYILNLEIVVRLPFNDNKYGNFISFKYENLKDLLDNCKEKINDKMEFCLKNNFFKNDEFVNFFNKTSF